MTEDKNAREAIIELLATLHGNGEIPITELDRIRGVLKGENAEPEIEVPAGWYPLKNNNFLLPEDYYFNTENESWEKCDDLSELKAEECNSVCIRKTIDIDLDRQPPELVAFVKGKSKKWYAHTATPQRTIDGWWHDLTSGRPLLESELPKKYTDNAQGSLLVRPEYYNQVTHEDDHAHG